MTGPHFLMKVPRSVSLCLSFVCLSLSLSLSLSVCLCHYKTHIATEALILFTGHNMNARLYLVILTTQTMHLFMT